MRGKNRVTEIENNQVDIIEDDVDFKVESRSTEIIINQGDITEEDVDAIVNAANEKLVGGGGVDGAIRKAGGDAVTKACDAIRAQQGGCPTGKAVITTSGNLPARYIIHTVGPVWQGGDAGEPELLESCYKECIMLAAKNGLDSIAFPSISTGVYGYPAEKAAIIALKTIWDLAENVDKMPKMPTIVKFVLFDDVTMGCYMDAILEL